MPPDATATSLGADTATTSSNTESFSTSTNYLCSSCQISFRDSQEQRLHMKEPWHVYNIKRRMESLPPIPLDLFQTQAEKKTDDKKTKSTTTVTQSRSSSKSGSRSASDHDISDAESEESASPFDCLFCNKSFTNNEEEGEQEGKEETEEENNDEASFAANLEHMRTAHGMSIPDPEMVIDIQSLIGYLATEVRVWHECLYCGATKPSTTSVQSHMRDKGHCRLNFDREPELLEFWENQRFVDEDGAAELEQEPSTNSSSTEIRVASGKIIGSKSVASAAKKASRKRTLATPMVRTLTSGSNSEEGEEEVPPQPLRPQLSSSRQLARRDEMSIIGLSVQQRQALVLAEKKAQRSEAMARRAREWVYAKGANSQKFDQLDNQMKWGKQNHKLLPR
ncbi:hypothetical protein TWF718_009952 [Orbilia javanica]|uniref:C2H2-type domain-containing protein n=1 Tax=Orbilia javanica TaxID=47235 RepID=A0AAN8RLT1_9PEZI